MKSMLLLSLPGTGRGTVRRTVEGALRPRNNCVGSANCIRKDALGRDPDHPEPVILDKLKSALVVFRLPTHVVDNAFDFDHQFVLQAAEIDDVGANRMLATPFEAARTLAELLP